MDDFPTLHTSRLTLRNMIKDDAPAVVRILNRNGDIANGVLNFPYPYPTTLFDDWLVRSSKGFASGESFNWVVMLEDKLIGNVGLFLRIKHARGGLGYWLDKDHWGQGYTTEAVRAVIDYGFDTLHLNRIYAECFPSNPASARVMEKAGMTYEATLRQPVWHAHSGEYRDLNVYAILHQEWSAANGSDFAT